MKIKDTLTILIPLKGRDKESKRILRHMNDVGIPYNILLADGSGVDNSDWINTKKYPNLNLTYHNFGPDKTMHDFMVKMNKACQLIKTPLTIMVDNDDFLSPNGIINAIKFLEIHPEYTSFRGDVNSWHGGVSIYLHPSVEDDSVYGRVEHSIRKRNAGWHDMVRTYTIKKLFAILDECGTNDFQLIMSMNSYWHMIYGLAFRSPDIPYYYHVQGNSLVQGKGVYSKYMDWHTDSRYNKSMAINISAVANMVHMYDGVDLELSKSQFANMLLTDIYNYCGKSTSTIVDDVKAHIDLSSEYDDIITKIVQRPDEMTTFNLTIPIGDVELNYNSDRNIIKQYL